MRMGFGLLQVRPGFGESVHKGEFDATKLPCEGEYLYSKELSKEKKLKGGRCGNDSFEALRILRRPASSYGFHDISFITIAGKDVFVIDLGARV